MATEPTESAPLTSDEPGQSWNVDGYVKGAQDFVSDTLQRTGTLYTSTKEAVLQRSGTLYEGARHGVSEGLKRTGTLYSGAKENVSAGLKRSGTVVSGARDGLVRRASVLAQPTKEGEHTMLQRTGTFLQETGQGMVKRTGTWFEDASTYARSFYDPSAPLKVAIRGIAGVDVQRVGHTLVVIDGRVYIFGGETEEGSLADNAMNVVILPSSGVHEADFKSIAARPSSPDGPVPEPRKGHSACVMGDEIFIFGGELAPKAKEEAGRVWVFDTFSNKWSYLDPSADAPYPAPRAYHAAAASEHPASKKEESTAYRSQTKPDEDIDERVEDETSNIDSERHGTLFVYGGAATSPLTPAESNSTDTSQPEQEQHILNDIWAFDIASRSWFTLPPPAAPPTSGSKLALAGPNLIRVNGHDPATGEWSIDSLDVSPLVHRHSSNDTSFRSLSLPSLLDEWGTSPLGRANVTTSDLAISVKLSGQSGKHFLLCMSGAQGNMLVLDVTPSAETIRLAGADFEEKSGRSSDGQQIVKKLHKVQCRFVDAYGETILEEAADGSGEKVRLAHGLKGFAFGNGSQVDESTMMVWGGRRAAGEENGKVFGRGWMVTLDV